ncbi:MULTISPECIES: hypothetical protein [Streptomyces]|uniref:hypothetical protein n=1 Tax=Streptomyces TaxID=1883 RepID=UPI00131BF146|nr:MULTISPECIES: hypothetical protein [Streptomyces]MDI5903768.1 hypothetical protein [Streptomyces sp. 12257]
MVGVQGRRPAVEGGGLLVREQSGDGLGDVTRVVTSAKVSGQSPSLLEVRAAVLDADAP